MEDLITPGMPKDMITLLRLIDLRLKEPMTNSNKNLIMNYRTMVKQIMDFNGMENKDVINRLDQII